jgi:L-2,4-diaminobutyrate decarboxylase
MCFILWFLYGVSGRKKSNSVEAPIHMHDFSTMCDVGFGDFEPRECPLPLAFSGFSCKLGGMVKPLHPLLKKAYDPDRFVKLGQEILLDLQAHLVKSQSKSSPASMPWVSPEEERLYWEKRLQTPIGLPALMREVVERSNQLQDPRYMGHQVAVPFPDGALVGMVTDLLNNGGAIYEMGPTNSAMEEVLMSQIGKLMGLPEGCGGVMCHGGTLANLVALLAARRWKGGAESDPWESGDDELGAVLVSEQAHYCVDRAVRIMGWGSEGVGLVPTDQHHRITKEGLEEAWDRLQSKGRRVVAVVGSACTTSVGAYDELHVLADFAGRHGLWFHVDGAHGAAAAFSTTHRHWVSGIERAHSVAMDFHKIMGVPALCTGLFYGQQDHSFLPFTQKAEYLWSDAEDPEWWNFGKRTFECTKRMLSTRVAAVLEEYGPEIWGHLVDRLFGLGNALAEQLKARKGFELAMSPDANIVCFRHVPESRMDASDEEMDRFTAALRQLHLERGPQYVVQTRFGGKTWLRCTLMNPLTEPQDLSDMLGRLEELGAEITLQ